MSEEEKQAIDFFEKSFKKKIPPYWYDDTISNIEGKIKTILNLIEKQQVEINKEKEKNKLLKSYSTNLPENVEMILLTKNDFERNISTEYISKDKIREKIEEYKKYDNGINYENEISILQELLEEE